MCWRLKQPAKCSHCGFLSAAAQVGVLLAGASLPTDGEGYIDGEDGGGYIDGGEVHSAPLLLAASLVIP